MFLVEAVDVLFHSKDPRLKVVQMKIRARESCACDTLRVTPTTLRQPRCAKSLLSCM